MRSASISLAIWILFAVNPASATTQSLPSQLETTIRIGRSPSEPVDGWSCVDWDADGNDELLHFRDARTLQIRTQGERVWNTAAHINLRESATVGSYCHACLCGDLSGDGLAEIAVTHAHGDSLWIDVYDQERIHLSFGPWPNPDSTSKGVQDGHRDSRVIPIGVVVHHESAESLLVVLANAGLDEGLRGVYALSLETGVEKWHFPTGSNPTAVTTHIVDLDRDGWDEILFTMPSPGNGRSINQTDDDHAWIVVLDSDGNLLWLRQLGGYYHHPSWCEIYQPNGGATVIITGTANRQSSSQDTLATGSVPIASPESLSAAQAEAGRDTLRVFAALSGEQLFAQAWDSPFWDICKLDESRLVVSDSDGVITLLEVTDSGNLIELQSRHMDPRVRIRVTADLDSDGRVDLIGDTDEWTTHLIVLDDALQTVASMELFRGAAIHRFGLLRRSGGNPTLIVRITDYLLALNMEPNEAAAAPLAAVFTRGWWRRLPGLAILILVILGSTAVMLFARRRRRWGNAGRQSPERPMEATAGQTEVMRQVASPSTMGPVGNIRDLTIALLQATEVGDHGELAVTRVPRRFAWLMEGITKQTDPSPEVLQRLQKAGDRFEEITLSQIENILALATALHFESHVIRDVRIGCQRLHVINRQVAPESRTCEYIKAACPEATEASAIIAQGLKAIRSSVIQKVTRPLFPAVEGAMDALREKAERANLNFTVACDAAVRSCSVRAYPGDLSVIIENLIDNGIRAVRGRPEREITIAGHTSERFIHIEIVDTGCGIPSSQWESIFEAGVSSRATGGTGLYVSRRLLDGLGGTLRVKASEVDHGTTMELRLLLEASAELASVSGIGVEAEECSQR